MNHFCRQSRRHKLALFFQIMVPGCLPLIVGSQLGGYFLYLTCNSQNSKGKLALAFFAPLIGVFLKVILRICVQRLYNITNPGYSYTLLPPLYFGSALIFRVLQAELDNLQSIAILGIMHGAGGVYERSAMVVIDHICHLVWKRTLAPWGSFRTPRRERLMADIAIMSMLSESIAIVGVNGFLYLYQFTYVKDKCLLRGHSGQLPCFHMHNVLALFLNYLHEISFNPKTLLQGCTVCSHKSVRIFSRFLK